MSDLISFGDFLSEKKSPYKPETLARYKKKFEKGEKIPFGIEASLKAQGMIPRADGTYKVSDEYKDKAKGGVIQTLKKLIKPKSEKDEEKPEAESKPRKEKKKKISESEIPTFLDFKETNE